ncbi:MAG TPA: hypothetical protein VKA38_04895, partial [Draconibacterium sp.]|nr:hypothetical protein [Draconibacterium sp.]
IVLLLIIWVRYFTSVKSRKQNLYLTVSGTGEGKPGLENIDSVVRDVFKASKLVRYDETSDLIEAAFWIEIKKTDDLQQFKNRLNEMNPEIRVSFVDNNSF